MFRPRFARMIRILSAVAACAALACPGAASEQRATRWHADLTRARGASAVSQRPVLAVFVASWSEESRRIASHLQASEEVDAVLAACFEAVVIDVEAQPDVARRLGISHVPTAVVIDAGDRPLATFECPDAVPAFVAAVTRAAQEVAARPAAKAAPVHAEPLSPLVSAEPVATHGSISMLTAKVRQLSDFAGDAPAGPQTASLVSPSLDASSPAQASVAEPVLPKAPPQLAGEWAAEQPATPLALAPTPAPHRPTIEPAAQAGVACEQPAAPPASWLAAAADTESSASVTDLPPASPAEPGKATPAANFWSTVRWPFAAAAAKPATAPAPAVKPAAPPTMPPARPQWPGALAATAPPASPPAAAPPTPAAGTTAPTGAEESMPLGLEGYCPVTLAEKQVWTEGRPQYGARHRGRTYLFAGAEQLRAFLADPDRYAPALSGDDPVLAFDQGRSMPGQRRYGVVCQSRMYLFTSPQTRDAFAANPERYAGRVALAEQAGTSRTRTY